MGLGGFLLEQKNMTDKQKQYITELTEAQEILGCLKTAYREHAQRRGLTKRYKIKDREMEFTDLSDLLKQIRYWEREVARLEVATGQQVARPRRIISRF